MRDVAFSGVQPSGVLHLGNYLGALKQWVALQDAGDHDLIFCVVDEHAITVPQTPMQLRAHTLTVAALYLAAGIDPERATVFIQSHVPAHAELGWILNTITPLGELERMTQFKDKAQDQKSVFAGLLNYPTLMAADILLYQTNVVPVGEDQKQHVELTRSIAERFNNRFGETFTVPELTLTKNTRRVMGLDDPTKKMSKSAPSEMNYISILDEPDAVRNKIQSATTDSGNEVRFDEGEKPGISNLLSIASGLSGRPIEELEKEFSGLSYVDFKTTVADMVIASLAPLRMRYAALAGDEDALREILRDGAESARARAEGTLSRVRAAVGFVER